MKRNFKHFSVALAGMRSLIEIDPWTNVGKFIEKSFKYKEYIYSKIEKYKVNATFGHQLYILYMHNKNVHVICYIGYIFQACISRYVLCLVSSIVGGCILNYFRWTINIFTVCTEVRFLRNSGLRLLKETVHGPHGQDELRLWLGLWLDRSTGRQFLLYWDLVVQTNSSSTPTKF